MNVPYPEVTGSAGQKTLANLYDLYAGRASEMTAICTYVYQHVLTEKEYAELAGLFMGIGGVEMRHLDLLAGAIYALGGDPVYAGRYSWFSGSYADYTKDVKLMLQNDIETEKAVAEAYKQAANATDNQSLAELLMRIAMDEELHAELLTCALEKL